MGPDQQALDSDWCNSKKNCHRPAHVPTHDPTHRRTPGAFCFSQPKSVSPNQNGTKIAHVCLLLVFNQTTKKVVRKVAPCSPPREKGNVPGWFGSSVQFNFQPLFSAHNTRRSVLSPSARVCGCVFVCNDRPVLSCPPPVDW